MGEIHGDVACPPYHRRYRNTTVMGVADVAGLATVSARHRPMTQVSALWLDDDDSHGM